MPRSSQPTVVEGDWIKLLTDHGGGTHVTEHIANGGLALVVRPGTATREMVVHLVDSTGAHLYSNYYVGSSGRWEKLDRPPEPKTLLGAIPNTAEVQALKEALWKSFTDASVRHGHSSVVFSALKALGIEKPGVGRLVGTATITFDVPSDRVLGDHVTDKNAKAEFERMNRVRQVRAVLDAGVSSDEIKVSFEVKPYAPVIVPSPSATPSATTESAQEQTDKAAAK